MASFPRLKTGAVAQYPAKRGFCFQNQVCRFLDGRSQGYRDSSGLRHTWEIRLHGLDETEMAALEQFFNESDGAFGSFAFTDPWDGQVYASCSFAGDQLELASLSELQGATALKVVENGK